MLCVNCCRFHLNEFLHAIALSIHFSNFPIFTITFCHMRLMFSSLTLLYFYFSSYYLLIDSIAAINVHFDYFFVVNFVCLLYF